MMKRTYEVTCILCPISCKAKLFLEGDEVISVENLECSRGKTYVENELKKPMRDFFTVVKVEGARVSVLPIRTSGPIPKEKMIDCSKELSKVIVKAPVKLGSIILKNLLNLGVDVISTQDLKDE